ncbi:hypothetical protein NQZ68_041634 [Dissostichus eleginoides]|nr:hypothetical protein NQZ68_041634 [Dissostichus eleginoides]
MTVFSDPAEALALAQELSVLLAKDAIEPRNRQIPEGAAIPYADHSTCTGGVVRNRGLEGCLLPRGPGKMVPYIQFLRPLGRLTAASAVGPLGPLSLRPMQMWLNSLHLDEVAQAQESQGVAALPPLSVTLEEQGLSPDGRAHGRHPIPPGDLGKVATFSSADISYPLVFGLETEGSQFPARLPALHGGPGVVCSLGIEVERLEWGQRGGSGG